jgi:hypothetical protein
MWCFDAGVVYPSLNSRIIPCLTCRTECTVTSIQFLSTNPLSYHIQPSMHQHLSFDTTLDYSQSKPRDKKRGNKRQEERNEQQREERTKRGKDEERKGRREERTKRETRRTAHTHLHAIQHSNEPPTYHVTSPQPSATPDTTAELSKPTTMSQNTAATRHKQAGQKQTSVRVRDA